MERLSDKTIEIINELHRERLDYESEYLPLIEGANRLAELEDKLESGDLMEFSLNAKMSLEKFTERFVAHNTSVQLFTDEIDIEDGTTSHIYTKIWEGMDWQIGMYGDDKIYFENHPDVKECPYSKANVVKVIGRTDGFHTVDEIAIAIDKQ